MKPNLAESFDVIRPALSPELVAGQVADLLHQLAGRLTPAPFVGFESRLRSDDPCVDLQQGFSCATAPALVTTCESMLASSSDGGSKRVWERLRVFALEWANASSEFRKTVPHIWLEFDLVDPLPSALVPSVFVTFKAPGEVATDAMPIEEKVLSFLTDSEVPAGLRTSLARCREACPKPSHISHLGLMLGRAAQGCRIHISQLPVASLRAYLEEIGWPGNGEDIQTLAAELLTFVDYTVLCIDVSEKVYPQLGLECFFNNPDDLNTPWSPVLEHLVERGLCTRPKCDGLLTWTGVVRPSSRSAPWPEALIIESLLQPPDRFSVFRRRLNHVKISLGPTCSAQAKAYFGYAHEWVPPTRLRAQVSCSSL